MTSRYHNELMESTDFKLFASNDKSALLLELFLLEGLILCPGLCLFATEHGVFRGDEMQNYPSWKDKFIERRNEICQILGLVPLTSFENESPLYQWGADGLPFSFCREVNHDN